MAPDILHHQQVSLFCSQIKLRRFDDSTLRILELILSAKNVNLSLELRNNLKEILRSQSLIAIREVADKSVEHKLLILDFFVRAFAIVDDVESCLALRYEGLNFRESWTMNHPELHVSYGEWMSFAEDAFNSSFYSVTAKVNAHLFDPPFSINIKETSWNLASGTWVTACENALLCLNVNGDFSCDKLAGNAKTMRKLQSLKDMAIRLSTSHSVQGQAAEYMRKKTLKLKQSSFSEEAESTASMCFRDGIKQKNIRNLLRLKYQ